jgi:hypothetical protein
MWPQVRQCCRWLDERQRKIEYTTEPLLLTEHPSMMNATTYFLTNSFSSISCSLSTNTAGLHTVRLRSHVPVFDRPGESTTWNFKTSPVLTGRSNDKERCDQAVVHAQWSAMDRNSVIALFLLYRRRKRRRNRLHWVHPIIQKREEFGAFTHYLVHYEMTQTSFLIIFECLYHLSTRFIAVWRTVFSVVTVKWGTAFNL